MSTKHYGFCLVPRLVMRQPRFATLPETAKWLYVCLKDICGETEKGECFYSLRNLEGLIHMSISTLSRSIHKLVGAGLILADKLGAKGREVFHIKIVNIWQENDATYRECFKTKQTDGTVSPCDTSPPSTVSESTPSVSMCNSTVSERNTPDDIQAQDCFNLTDKEDHLKKTNLEEDLKEENESSPSSSDLSSQERERTPTNSEELLPLDQLRFWLKELEIYGSKDPAKASADLALFAPYVHSINDLKDLYTYAKEHIYGENKTVFLGNLARNVEGWIKSRDIASERHENALNATMDKGQAEAFALSLLSTFPAELLAIDQSYPNDDQIWSTCIQYAPEEWVYFENEEHYNNPSEWERARIEQAQAWGRALLQKRAV